MLRLPERVIRPDTAISFRRRVAAVIASPPRFPICRSQRQMPKGHGHDPEQGGVGAEVAREEVV